MLNNKIRIYSQKKKRKYIKKKKNYHSCYNCIQR